MCAYFNKYTINLKQSESLFEKCYKFNCNFVALYK